MAEQLDVNELVNGLLDQIANQAKEIALLRVQLAMAQKQPEDTESAGDVDGSE